MLIRFFWSFVWLTAFCLPGAAQEISDYLVKQQHPAWVVLAQEGDFGPEADTPDPVEYLLVDR
ncbi:hypothetical protein [uncultured Roseovarius sp.]|uniref:hypothetical protein n=1 Tax=uncultured Roseovarius sp. TaxID=293344 RepID=UPI00263705EA|nr:hypothetical protein [uncultured Roseovarius sp.]